MQGKRTLSLIAIAAITENFVSAQTPCYGFGKVFGTPQKYIASDLSKVTELKVGQSNVQVANLDYLFAGYNFLQVSYSNTDDLEWSDKGMGHGAADVFSNRFTKLEPGSRLLNPSWLYDTTGNTAVSLMFDEYSTSSTLGTPYILAAFDPR